MDGGPVSVISCGCAMLTRVGRMGAGQMVSPVCSESVLSIACGRDKGSSTICGAWLRQAQS